MIAVISLSQSLGLARPWLRLSVVGSLSYEAIAAANAASGMGMELSDLVGNMTPDAFLTIAIVMTVSIMVGIWLVPVLAKRMQSGLVSFEKKDKRWSEILQNSLFIGMISAFVGFVFCNLDRLWRGPVMQDGVILSRTSGLIPVLVMAVSGLTMLICGLLMTVFKWKWLTDYALSISMVLGMASAIPLTALLGG